MKLIELSANKESFKTVTFNKSGLSFIVAKQKNPESNDNSKTYNGVGKSLIVLLIHFCLGAKKDHYKSFIEKLPDWIFYLTIELDGKSHIIKRTMGEPTKIYFDDEPAMTIDNFYEKIRQKVFDFPQDTQNLTFRNTLPLEYLDEIKPIIKEKQEFFRKLAKRFYPKNASGITVYNNKGENQQRYTIEAKIESDNSDGINNIKIFCYDITMLFKGHDHNVKFSFHDSRLFDGIDEKHKAEIFKVVDELFIGTEFQYIATINQNQLNEVKSILTQEEYQEIIEQNTILTLTDENDSEKLLGVKVDVRYE